MPLFMVVEGEVCLSYIDYFSLVRAPACEGFSKIPGAPDII